MGGTPYNSLYGRISRAEVYDRVGKPVEGLTGAFMAVKKSRKRLACVASVSSRGSSRKLGQEQKKNECFRS